MAQFVLKIAHLAILMEPTPLLDEEYSYRLLPRLSAPAVIEFNLWFSLFVFKSVKYQFLDFFA